VLPKLPICFRKSARPTSIQAIQTFWLAHRRAFLLHVRIRGKSMRLFIDSARSAGVPVRIYLRLRKYVTGIMSLPDTDAETSPSERSPGKKRAAVAMPTTMAVGW
jgi:hypothetical protein